MGSDEPIKLIPTVTLIMVMYQFLILKIAKFGCSFIFGVTISCLVNGAVIIGLGYLLFKKYRILRMRYRKNLPDGTENRFSLMLENSAEPENLIEL